MRSCGVFARALRIAVLLSLVALVVPAPGNPAPATAGAPPTTYWVDAVNGSDGNAGTEAAPFKTITYALTRSSSPDTLMIEPGTYDTVNGEVFPLGVMGEALIGTGGAHETFIVSDGAHQAITAQSFAPGDVIKGFKFTGGVGGAIQIYLSADAGPESPLIEGNIFEGNSNGDGGGALALSAGGSQAANPAIRYNTFIDNSASGGSGGGAIYLDDYVSATIEYNVFDGNQSAFGGAICAGTTDSTLTVVGNYFASNRATVGNGGAVYLSHTGGQDHRIEDNVFLDNTAQVDGGALWLYGAQVRVSGNEADGNTATDFGGFAWSQFCSLEAENNVIRDCDATESGAAWYAYDALITERNDTVVNCGSGAAFAADANVDAVFEIRDSIYWNPAIAADIRYADVIEDSCVRDPLVADASRGNSGVTNVMSDDPMFIDLAADDARLALGSPCIDAADAATSDDQDFYNTTRPQDGDGDGVAAPDMGFFEKPALELGALAGDDRYLTAVEIASETFESADVAVVASGQNFPDALSAAGLAGSYGAPLVLTKTATLPSEVHALLTDLGVTRVYVVGGTAAVSDAVFAALDADFEVERIWGADRYETAANVAEEIALHQASDFDKQAFIARGDAFPDALSVSPLAYAGAIPILLTKTGGLPTATQAALESLDIENAVIAGGTSAVSAATQAAIDGILDDNGGAASDRWFGADRYATAATIATEGVDAGYATWDTVGIATGENYPDALAGGVRVGYQGGVVLLTNTASLPAVTATALEDHADRVLYVDVFGGTAAVTNAVRDAIADALGW